MLAELASVNASPLASVRDTGCGTTRGTAAARTGAGAGAGAPAGPVGVHAAKSPQQETRMANRRARMSVIV